MLQTEILKKQRKRHSRNLLYSESLQICYGRKDPKFFKSTPLTWSPAKVKRTFPVRLDGDFILKISKINKGLQKYINFGRENHQDLCIFEAKLRLSILILEEVTYYSEQQIKLQKQS